MDWIAKLDSEYEAGVQKKNIFKRTRTNAPKPLKLSNSEHTVSEETNIFSAEQQDNAATIHYPKPFITNGELRIPLDCHPTYKWWNGGQTIYETLTELEAPRRVWLSHLDHTLKLVRGESYKATFMAKGEDK